MKNNAFLRDVGMTIKKGHTCKGSTHGVMDIIIANGHGDMSSNPGQG